MEKNKSLSKIDQKIEEINDESLFENIDNEINNKQKINSQDKLKQLSEKPKIIKPKIQSISNNDNNNSQVNELNTNKS
jgi:hypothetical protein